MALRDKVSRGGVKRGDPPKSKSGVETFTIDSARLAKQLAAGGKSTTAARADYSQTLVNDARKLGDYIISKRTGDHKKK